MTVYKIQNRKDGSIQWAKNRAEITLITGLSRPTMTQAMRQLCSGGLYASRNYIVSEVEVVVHEVV